MVYSVPMTTEQYNSLRAIQDEIINVMDSIDFAHNWDRLNMAQAQLGRFLDAEHPPED
jgi:hypothetical protein